MEKIRISTGTETDMQWQIIAAIAGGILLVLLTVVLIWYRRRRKHSASYVGTEFEKYCAQLLWKNGFKEVELTRSSGDFGVDIFARKDGVSWAFQCKCYDKPVGIHAVQEIYSGRDFYHCMVGVVMTNSTYTGAAIKLAEAHNILVWDGEQMEALAKRR